MLRLHPVIALLGIMLLGQTAFAQLSEEEINIRKQVEGVFAFLSTRVENCTLVRESEGKLADGKVGYTFRREATLVNLARTPLGFEYDTIYKISQQNWDLGPDGQKQGAVRTEDRMLVVHTSMAVRKSTYRLAGLSVATTSSRRDWGGSAQLLTMKMEEGRLLVTSRTALYDDFFAAGGGFYAGASVDTETWSMKDGKLVRETKSQAFKVDPETLEMKPSGEVRTLNEVEVARLPR